MASRSVRGLIVCVAVTGLVALTGCSSNYYSEPSSGDRRIWAEELSIEDQLGLCAAFWNDEGYRNDIGFYREMLRDGDFGAGMSGRMADAVVNMVVTGEGCP